MNRQRKDVIKGSVTIAGNEFYQLGDVVYVTDRELLYYVVGVKHNFDYNGTFTTTLDLRYGHIPGDYIPTPLDIIGKLVIGGKRREFSFARENPYPERNERLITVVRFAATDEMRFTEGMPKNVAALSNAYMIAKNYVKPNNEVNVIVRCFFAEDQERAQDHVAAVKSWFENPVDTNGNRIDYLAKCGLLLKNSDDNKPRITTQAVEYAKKEDVLKEQEENPNVKILAPTEEVLDLVNSGGKAIEDVVEISISFEQDVFRTERFSNYYNVESE